MHNTGASGTSSSLINNAFLATIFLVGTGGFANPKPVAVVPTGSLLYVRAASEPAASAESDRLLDAQEKLAGIRRYLSMTVTELAQAMRVGRPTIYSWLGDEAVIRARHAKRLEYMYRLSREWRTVSSRPVGRFLSVPLEEGGTLLALLSAKTIDEPAVKRCFSQIAEALMRTSDRPGVVELAKRRGLKLALTQQSTRWSSADDVDM
jgi:AcrR family transcriptional regulator